MRKGILFLAMFMSVSAGLGAGDAKRLYEQANTYYQQGDYDSAIAYYNRILDEGQTAYELFFNLGNAYFKAGNIGKSILYYEKAKVLDPDNDDLLYNLELANLRIKDQIEPLPRSIFRQASIFIVSLFPSAVWSWVAISLIWLAFVSYAIYLFAGSLSRRKSGYYAALLAFLLSLACFSLALSRHQYDKNNRFGVITAPSAIIKSEPNEASMDMYLLHQGLKLQLLDEVGDWKKVRLADGNIGWMLSEKVEEI